MADTEKSLAHAAAIEGARRRITDEAERIERDIAFLVAPPVSVNDAEAVRRLRETAQALRICATALGTKLQG